MEDDRKKKMKIEYDINFFWKNKMNKKLKMEDDLNKEM